MKKFNKSKVIIPALAMIALTTAASATGTVAWFTANTATTVTGMTFTAKASSNLLIAPDVITSTTKVADANFTETLNQATTGDLAPVSTINGKDFYYTAQANANGSQVSGATYSTLDNNTIDTKKGYMEYVFQLKATNVETTSPRYIHFTKMELNYATAKPWGEGTPDDDQKAASLAVANMAKAIKAYRAAVFVQTITSSNPSGNQGSANAVGIYKQNGGDNFTDTKAISSLTNLTTPVMGDVAYVSAATPVATVDPAKTEYYKVVVRLWLEGEDETCYNSAFLGVTDNWSLNLALSLQSDTTGAVTDITSVVVDSALNKKSTNGGDWAANS